MRSLYRRHVKIKLLAESEKDQAHGWANIISGTGQHLKQYFKADQARLVKHLTRNEVRVLRLQFERMEIYPQSITIIKDDSETITYQNSAFKTDHLHVY